MLHFSDAIKNNGHQLLFRLQLIVISLISNKKNTSHGQAKKDEEIFRDNIIKMKIFSGIIQ